jgi:hypothetical protein
MCFSSTLSTFQLSDAIGSFYDGIADINKLYCLRSVIGTTNTKSVGLAGYVDRTKFREGEKCE